MPLQLVGPTEEDAHLAPGLTEEITTALARFRWMFVVACNSLDRFAMENRDEAAIRRTFGIDFLLDGTIQRLQQVADHRSPARPSGGEPGRVGPPVRSAVKGYPVAAGRDRVRGGRPDRSGDPADRGKRSASPPPSDPTAYDLMLRALPLISRLEREAFRQGGVPVARDRYRAGIRRRPRVVRLLVGVPDRAGLDG